MAWTYFNQLAQNLGQRLSGIFAMEPSTGRSLLYEVQNESKGNIDTITGTTIPALAARVVVLEQAISAPVADTTALKAIAAASRFDKMLAFCESAQDGLGHLYRFDSGSAAAEDLPFVVAPTAGTGRWLIDEEAEREMGSAVADITALKAVTAAQRTGGQVRLVVTNGTHADLYFFDALSAAAESLPDIVAPTAGTGRWLSYRSALKVYNDTLYDATGTAAGLLATKVLTPVAGTAALAALDVGGVLAAGVSCLVVDRGDGYAWRYRYVVGVVPTINYGTIGGVRVYTSGTNGYWTPEDLPAYIALANAVLAQRMGSLGGGMLGTASAWKLSDEANSPTGHAFKIDWDGAHPEDVTVPDAVKAAGTSIALTCELLNIAIANQCAVATNLRARIVYDDIAGAYRVVLPADVSAAALAITAPAAGNDISIAAKLAVATGTGTLFARVGRAAVDTAIAHPASSGASHSAVAAATAALLTLPSKGTVGIALLPLTGGTFTAGNHVDIGGVAFTARAVPGAVGTHEFALTGVLDTEVDNLIAVINNAADNAVKVKAIKPGADTLAISFSDATHVPEVVGVPDSIALALTVTAPLVGPWSALNLNLTGSAPSLNLAHGRIVVSGEMATAMAVGTGLNVAKIPFAFTATASLQLTVRDGAGVLKAVSDQITLDPTSETLVVLTAGAGAHIVGTDVLDFIVIA